MEELANIRDIVMLTSKLQGLCEGFDETNKAAVLTVRVKILMELYRKKNMLPNVLKSKVGLAKSNLAILCNNMAEEGLISKTKDSFDSRAIFYNITDAGIEYLNATLKQMKKNFEGQLAYKNNMKQVDSSVKDLLELVD